MPVAERNDEIPQGQAKGKASEQAEFIDATGGQTPLTAAAPVNEPIPIQPQVLGAFTEPDVEVDDVVNPGEELDPGMFEALADGNDATSLNEEEAAALAEWLPVIGHIASLPEATTGMKQLFQELTRRKDA